MSLGLIADEAKYLILFGLSFAIRENIEPSSYGNNSKEASKAVLEIFHWNLKKLTVNLKCIFPNYIINIILMIFAMKFNEAITEKEMKHS